MLKGRYMRENKGTRTPKSVIHLDTESWVAESPLSAAVQVNRFRLAVACHDRLDKGVIREEEWGCFTDIAEFWGWVTSSATPRTPTWVFAHNLGYDLTQLRFWDQLESGSFALSDPRTPPPARDGSGRLMRPRRGYAVLEDPPTIVRCFTQSGNVLVMVDTFNYFRCSVSEMGESIGLPKRAMPGQWDSHEDWVAYCLRDVNIIRRTMTRFMQQWHEWDLGVWKATAGGLAMTCYRHGFMQPNRSIRVDPDGLPRQLARACYYGGEVAAWYRGKVACSADARTERGGPMRYVGPPLGPIVHLDVSAAYPFVMAKHRYPYELVDVLHSPSLARTAKLLLHYDGAAVVEISSSGRAYPRRRDGLTRHVYGRYITALCGAELRYALGQGDVMNVLCFAYYSCDYLFREYMEYWWDNRRDAKRRGDHVWADVSKLLSNSLHGKFGQMSPTWIERPDVRPPCPWGPFFQSNPETGAVDEYRSVAWHAQQHVGTSEHPDSMPIIAACTTAALRVYMRHLRGIAGEPEVVYQDTDSLHVTITGFDRLKSAVMIGDDVMGRLRLVEIINRGEYRGPRNYAANGREVVSGLKGSAERLSGSVWLQSEWQKASQVVATRPDGTVKVTTRTFTVPGSVDDHGTAPIGRWNYPLINDLTVDEPLAAILGHTQTSARSPEGPRDKLPPQGGLIDAGKDGSSAEPIREEQGQAEEKEEDT